VACFVDVIPSTQRKGLAATQVAVESCNEQLLLTTSLPGSAHAPRPWISRDLPLFPGIVWHILQLTRLRSLSLRGFRAALSMYADSSSALLLLTHLVRQQQRHAWQHQQDLARTVGDPGAAEGSG
jgi:hypothetical protein